MKIFSRHHNSSNQKMTFLKNENNANLMRKRSWDLFSNTSGDSEGVLGIILAFPVSDEGGTAIESEV
jgi:hypothetical protein